MISIEPGNDKGLPEALNRTRETVWSLEAVAGGAR